MNGKAILIVEDENIVALDMKMRLESLGYSVIGVVDTGQAALDFLSRAKPDLVLMDIKLKSGSDGIETARTARERVEVPIIFVTAFTDESTLERAKLASPYGYIVKPFHERELRIAIELALYKFQYELSIRRSKDLAEEANRAKGEFLANVSHELKTPLNSVIGFTELSLERSGDEEQREYLASVLRAARSLVTLIDSILDFARLENGKLAPLVQSFSIDELLGECAEFLAVGATARNLELHLRRDRALPEYLVADRGRIRQIVMNLADNAVKFTEKGRIRLAASLVGPGSVTPSVQGRGRFLLGPRSAVHTAIMGPGEAVLRLVVEDTGTGMAEDKIGRAFERFTQLDGSTTRTAGGTGIGLAIVAKSLDLLGGSLAVQSRLGEGSAFEVLIPVSIDESRSRKGPPPLEEREALVVGFGPEARLDFLEVLERLGAASRFVDDLEEARRFLEGSPGAFLVTDEAGLAAARADLESLRGRLLVACRPGFSGRAELSAHGIGVLPHPVRAEGLLAGLRFLDEDSTGRAAPGSAETGRPGAVERIPPTAARGAEAGADLEACLEVEECRPLGSFLKALEEGIDLRDGTRLENAAKEYRDTFHGLGQDGWEKLAFSSLLLARKGDWKGLGEALERGRGLVKAETDGREPGGGQHAVPGR